MAEAALLVVGMDALPSGMVLDDGGDEERTSDHPREEVLACWRDKMHASVPNSSPGPGWRPS